jgi:hypothetical protein
MIHGLQFFLQKVSIAYYVITERIGIISLKAALWNFRRVRRGFERGRYLICLREENSYLFIYLFKLISIHPIQVHTMGMERGTFIIHPQAFTI